MKSNLTKSLMVLAACGVMAGTASVASAADWWHHHSYHGPVVRVGFGIAVNPVIVAPCPPAVVVEPVYVHRPYWRHEVIVREPVYRHRRW